MLLAPSKLSVRRRFRATPGLPALRRKSPLGAGHLPGRLPRPEFARFLAVDFPATGVCVWRWRVAPQGQAHLLGSRPENTDVKRAVRIPAAVKYSSLSLSRLYELLSEGEKMRLHF